MEILRYCKVESIWNGRIPGMMDVTWLKISLGRAIEYDITMDWYMNMNLFRPCSSDAFRSLEEGTIEKVVSALKDIYQRGWAVRQQYKK